MTNLQVGHPNPKNLPGTVTITLTDLQTNAPVTVTVNIPAGSNCFTKADAIAKEINDQGQGVFTATYPGKPSRTVTITDNNQLNTMGMAMKTVDTTGENGGLKEVPPFRPWYERFVLWLFGLKDGARPNDVVPPNGTVMTMAFKEPSGTILSVSVTGNGVLTVAQLQQQAINQFEALGINFTIVTDPETGQTGYMTQSFEITKAGVPGWFKWNGGYSTYLGGAGIQGTPAP